MQKYSLSCLRQTALLALGGLLSAPLFAQTDLPPVSLSQLTRPNSWQLVGSVSPTADGSSMRAKAGTNVLTGSGDPISLLTPTDDFQLHFDLMSTPGADVVLTLPTGQSLSLTNLPNMARLLKAPGLWQTVDVWYKTGSKSGPAMLEKLVLNDITVREGQILTDNKKGPLTLMAKSGSVAIRNVGYRIMSPRQVAQWSGPLSYTIYEGESGTRQELATKKIVKQDTTSAINHGVSYGQPNRYALLFSGKLNALHPGEYRFDLQQGGIADLRIDGKEIVPATYHEIGQPSTVTTNLTAGPHTVEIFFGRTWPRPGLGLFVSQKGTFPQPLHALNSLPDPAPVAIISVNPDYNDPQNQTQRIRSFVQMPGERSKRTHSLSVGSPTGMHYTVDLDQMALLQVWKGDFANVTEMWHERGEPQLLEPMGTLVRLPAQTPLMVLANESTVWPDSVGENTLQYKGLTVDKRGNPTMKYMLAGASVTDEIRPDGDALVRTLTLTGTPDGTPYCRIATGTSVEEVAKGLYAINDRSYFVRVDPKAKTQMRQSNGKQELLMPVSMKNGNGIVVYSVVF